MDATFFEALDQHVEAIAAAVTLAGHFLAGAVILWTAVAGAIWYLCEGTARAGFGGPDTARRENSGTVHP